MGAFIIIAVVGERNAAKKYEQNRGIFEFRAKRFWPEFIDREHYFTDKGRYFWLSTAAILVFIASLYLSVEC